jgi:N-acetylglutamate synthase and related acetyltransferases
MRMATAITTRVATVDDFPWIIELIDRNRAEQLSEQQRATAGFVQGRWNIDTLQQLLAGPGMFIAEVDGIRAGVALSSSPGAVTTGPAGRTNELAADHFGDTGYFLYGPVVVDADFRGQGVLRHLVDRLLGDAAAHYRIAVAFVEQANTNSLAVHQHLGWQTFATFDLAERGFLALAQRLAPTAESGG